MGPKPNPGDGEPVLGRVDEVDGLYVVFTLLATSTCAARLAVMSRQVV